MAGTRVFRRLQLRLDLHLRTIRSSKQHCSATGGNSGLLQQTALQYRVLSVQRVSLYRVLHRTNKVAQSLRHPLVSHIQKVHASQVKAPDKLCRRHAVLRFPVRKYNVLLLFDCVHFDIADGVFAFHYQSHISVTSIPCFSMSIFFFIL